MSHTPLFRQFIRIFQKAHQANLPIGAIPPTRQGWTRRRWLKSAALATGAALTARSLPGWSKAIGQKPPRIAIVGGGLAGLTAAFYLKQANLSATLYEGRDRLGGRVYSSTGAVGEGLTLDLGGSFINTDHDDILHLVEEFGLTLFNRKEDAAQFPFPETGYFFGGKRRSEAEVANDLRPLARQIALDAALLDRAYDRVAPLLDRLSVKGYLDRNADKITEPYIRVLIENTIRTEYGVEPENSSALQLIFNLPTVNGSEVEVLGNSDEALMVTGGSDSIITALAQSLQGQIQTRKLLTKVKSRGHHLELTFFPNQVVEVDYVILAMPFTTLRAVDLEVDLPRSFRDCIRDVGLGSNEKLFAGFSQKIWRRTQGFILEAWTDLGFAEVWDGTQPQTDRGDGVLSFFFGGDQTKVVLNNSTANGGNRVLQGFERAIARIKEVATGKFLKTSWTNDPLTQGSYTNFQPGQLTAYGEYRYIESRDPQERQDVAFNAVIFAGEQFSDEYYGFMNGAVQTGRLAAEVILGKLHQPQG